MEAPLNNTGTHMVGCHHNEMQAVGAYTPTAVKTLCEKLGVLTTKIGPMLLFDLNGFRRAVAKQSTAPSAEEIAAKSAIESAAEHAALLARLDAMEARIAALDPKVTS